MGIFTLLAYSNHQPRVTVRPVQQSYSEVVDWVPYNRRTMSHHEQHGIDRKLITPALSPRKIVSVDREVGLEGHRVAETTALQPRRRPSPFGSSRTRNLVSARSMAFWL